MSRWWAFACAAACLEAAAACLEAARNRRSAQQQRIGETKQQARRVCCRWESMLGAKREIRICQKVYLSRGGPGKPYRGNPVRGPAAIAGIYAHIKPGAYISGLS